MSDKPVELRPYQRRAVAWMSAQSWRITVAVRPTGSVMTSESLVKVVCDESPSRLPMGHERERRS